MAQILIVDNDVDILVILAKIITENTNYNVTTTNNPLEVPKLIKEGAYDLLIVALEMPGMDDTELIAEVKKKDKYMPIIINPPHDSIYNTEHNILNTITKPLRKEQILVSINRALEEKKMIDMLFDRQREL